MILRQFYLYGAIAFTLRATGEFGAWVRRLTLWMPTDNINKDTVSAERGRRLYSAIVSGKNVINTPLEVRRGDIALCQIMYVFRGLVSEVARPRKALTPQTLPNATTSNYVCSYFPSALATVVVRRGT